MKTIFKIILITIFVFSLGCQNKEKVANKFSSLNDTLIIRTKKEKGNGLFQLGATNSLNFKDTIEKFPYSIHYPKNIQGIKRLLFQPDFKEKQHFYVDILKGVKDGKNVFVVDENNNKNLSDDSIRIFDKIKWYSSENLIKCKYDISNGKQIVKDSSWLKIGTSNNNLFIGRSEHLIGEFSIDDENYELGIVEFRNAISFTYGFDSELALLSYIGNKKDSIYNRDLLKLGELLNLNDKFYRFKSISNNGEYITLVKEGNFDNEIGTQTGMIAPSFKVVTVAGDTISSPSLHNKVTVIANSCGCGGDKKSTQAFYDIKNTFKNINVLHIDSKIEKESDGTHIDVENDFNKDFYNIYRKQYCSRICYIIGKNNRIVDKFNIMDWKTILPKLIIE